MNTPKDDKKLEQSAKALFDDSVARLDAATLSKLNQGRQAAIAELADESPARQWVRWMPATGVATVALVAILVLRAGAADEDGVLIEVETHRRQQQRRLEAEAAEGQRSAQSGAPTATSAAPSSHS